MSAALIAQLVVALGPSAFQLIQELIAVWSKPALTVEEVNAICNKAQQSYDSYIDAAKSQAQKTP